MSPSSSAPSRLDVHLQENMTNVIVARDSPSRHATFYYPTGARTDARLTAPGWGLSAKRWIWDWPDRKEGL